MRHSPRLLAECRCVEDQWYHWPPTSDAPTLGPFHTLTDLLGAPFLSEIANHVKRTGDAIPSVRDLPLTDHQVVDLRRCRKIVYTIARNVDRQNRLREIFAAYGWTNWSFFEGEPSQPYFKFHCRDHAAFLRSYDPPLLIMEDDAEPREPYNAIVPPIAAQIVYLCGCRDGDHLGRLYARRRTNIAGRYAGYLWQHYSADYFRMAGMYSSAAVLWLDKYSMLATANYLEQKQGCVDINVSHCHWKYRVFASVIPHWWQNDGHHWRSTYCYSPPILLANKHRKPYDR